jgi:NADPH:quinone reductase-like Zn-dependent oxidoreductase
MPLAPPPPFGTPMLPADSFAGKTVLITGGGTGVGLAMEQP